MRFRRTLAPCPARSRGPSCLRRSGVAVAVVVALCFSAACNSSATPNVFRLGGTEPIDSMNPFVAVNSSSYAVFENIYPSLVQVDPALRTVPDFAGSWQMSPDGKTWTFHTEPGAKWSDGEPLTAADAAWTFETVIKHQEGPTGSLAGYVAHMESATAPDPNTLVLKYSRPVANVLAQMSGIQILPEHVWARFAAGDGKGLLTFTNPAPVVSGGPFTPVKYAQSRIALLKRNPRYYGPSPHIDGGRQLHRRRRHPHAGWARRGGRRCPRRRRTCAGCRVAGKRRPGRGARRRVARRDVGRSLLSGPVTTFPDEVTRMRRERVVDLHSLRAGADPGRDAAVNAADLAARAAGVHVREVAEVGELEAVNRLYDTIWRPEPSSPPVPLDFLRALVKAGNYVTGAFDGPQLVGACVGFFGPPAKEAMHSHIAGVSAAAHGRSVGFALKLHQRAWAMTRGVSEIAWTFDPLVSRNAYFNLAKLAAGATEYLTDFYGGMHDGINGYVDTDRLLVRWSLHAPEVAAAGAGTVRPCDAESELRRGAVVVLARSDDGSPVLGVPDGNTLLVAVPPDITSLRAAEPEHARAWRTAVREALTAAMADGLHIAGFDKSGWYVLRRDTTEGQHA